jgi:hypothetical protein
MSRSVAIMGYGTQDDRRRVEALARLQNISVSQWLIATIRREYTAVYGDAKPAPALKESSNVR